MDEILKIVLALSYGYLVGSISISYLLGKVIKGVDLRFVGTGTLGASNVWQQIGKRWVYPVVLFDFLAKGVSPVALSGIGLGLNPDAQAGAALLAVIGHNWPIFLRFQGGRGVTPLLGVLFAFPIIGLGDIPISLVLFAIIALGGSGITRNAPLWVLIAAILLPIWPLLFSESSTLIWLNGSLLTVLILKRLTSNFGPEPGSRVSHLIWNRLLYDRDTSDRTSWIKRH
jgi:glycerol-3-phosphate acyltransferase PlsY